MFNRKGVSNKKHSIGRVIGSGGSIVFWSILGAKSLDILASAVSILTLLFKLCAGCTVHSTGCCERGVNDLKNGDSALKFCSRLRPFPSRFLSLLSWSPWHRKREKRGEQSCRKYDIKLKVQWLLYSSYCRPSGSSRRNTLVLDQYILQLYYKCCHYCK